MIVMVLVLIFSVPAFAGQVLKPDTLSLCELAGSAYGAQKQFIGSLAARLLDKAGLSAADPKCGPIWREAYQVGLRANLGDIKSQADMDLMLRLYAFEATVLDAVLKGIAD
jgi:hypothetical protein